MKYTIRITSVIFCIGHLIACATQEKNSPSLPNIILIMADDLGYGDLSCYGNDSISTPNLDRLAREGMKFWDFHTNGAVCSPTRAALMSGKYPQRVGISKVVATWTRDTLGMSPKVETLAEVFQEGGYTTGIFGKWHLGYRTDFNPLVQGFDEFKGFVAGNVDYHSHLDNLNYFDWWEGTQLKEDPGYTTDLITKYGLAFLKRNSESPFFLYLPHEAPHSPYQGREDPPIRVKGQENRKVDPQDIPRLYKEMVEVMDEGIGKILAALDTLGLAENTFVFFCSDNGANSRGSNGSLRGHKGGLYEGGHRVPAIAKWPGHIPPNSQSHETILTMDMFPTLLEVAGIPLGERSLDGISIVPHITQKSPLPSRKFFWSYDEHGIKKAMRHKEWKWVDIQGKKALFNLDSDLAETRDLREDNPKLAEEMEQEFTLWKHQVEESGSLLAREQ